MADEADHGSGADDLPDFEGDVPDLPDGSLRGGHASVDEQALPDVAVGIPLPPEPPAPQASPPDSTTTG
ncbi:hypothetical protein [Streptomyces lutosisoli]|uniref:hypothetical protein n=1 Tax=Streptomyces lutosisoli TaxID=2665721 RepID=UPI0036153B2F